MEVKQIALDLIDVSELNARKDLGAGDVNAGQVRELRQGVSRWALAG